MSIVTDGMSISIVETSIPYLCRNWPLFDCVCLLVRTGTKNIHLVVRLEMDRSNVGPGFRRLLDIEPFKQWSVVERFNSGSTMCGTAQSVCLYYRTNPVPVCKRKHLFIPF
jgi:hypothetical protein